MYMDVYVQYSMDTGLWELREVRMEDTMLQAGLESGWELRGGFTRQRE